MLIAACLPCGASVALSGSWRRLGVARGGLHRMLQTFSRTLLRRPSLPLKSLRSICLPAILLVSPSLYGDENLMLWLLMEHMPELKTFRVEFGKPAFLPAWFSWDQWAAGRSTSTILHLCMGVLRDLGSFAKDLKVTIGKLLLIDRLASTISQHWIPRTCRRSARLR